MSAAKTTINHDEIRRWVEARGGRPAVVAATSGEQQAGILRIDYPERGDPEALHDISWEEFFEAFEANELAFLYQDETSGGERSRFSKFVRRQG